MSKRSRHNLHYLRFVDSIDVDQFEAAINFVPFEHRKGEDVGHCPDVWGLHKHGDTSGKFAINREKKVYHCFVCGGGTLLSLAMEYFGMNEEDATHALYEFTREDMRTDSDLIEDLKAKLREDDQRKADKVPFFNERVLDQFDKAGADIFGYCTDKGIAPEIAWEFKVGYHKHYKKASPIRGGDKIDDDYYGPVIVFPHFWDEKLVGWQHRWLNYGKDTPKWLPKYTNTSDFPKSETLFNYDRARLDTRRGKAVIIVESVPTVLFLESFGYPAVSTFGSGITDGQIKYLSRLESGVIIAPDNDSAGHKFECNAVDALIDRIPLTILPPVDGQEGADLADLWGNKNPGEALEVALQSGHEPRRKR